MPQPPDRAPLAVAEAQRRVLEAVTVLAAENVPLAGSLGRVLREDVQAPRDLPAAPTSAMDGYAVRAADLAGAAPDSPIALAVVDDIGAGRTGNRTIEAGCAARIMTGAPLPAGADAVVPVELTDGGTAAVLVRAAVAIAAHVRPAGEDMRAGELLLAAGSVLGPGEIGVAAAAGRAALAVGVRPRVSILSTGDELVEVGGDAGGPRIVNSNAHALAALVTEAGGVAIPCGIAADDPAATRSALERALSGADICLSSGGVSAGAYDYVRGALASLGAEELFYKVAMKPGKPLLVARRGATLAFGLPGNPVSCMVAFMLFVRPALRRAMGQERGLFPPIVRCRLATALGNRGERPAYLRVRVIAIDGELVAEPARAQGSGVSTSMVGANGLALLGPDARLGAGDTADVLMIGEIQ